MLTETEKRVLFALFLIAFGFATILKSFNILVFDVIFYIAVFGMFLSFYLGIKTIEIKDRNGFVFSVLLFGVSLIIMLQNLRILVFSMPVLIGSFLMLIGFAIIAPQLVFLKWRVDKESKNIMLWGSFLFLLGAIIVLNSFNLLPLSVLDILRKSLVGVVFILVGLFIIFKGTKKKE